jgi:hypothetical protein
MTGVTVIQPSEVTAIRKEESRGAFWHRLQTSAQKPQSVTLETLPGSYSRENSLRSGTHLTSTDVMTCTPDMGNLIRSCPGAVDHCVCLYLGGLYIDIVK